VLQLVALAHPRSSISGGGTRNRSSIAFGTTTTFSGGTLKKCRMSRLDASDTVMIDCARRAAAHITERA
jgi:hypothetical protein